jgi:hypothetical protein
VLTAPFAVVRGQDHEGASGPTGIEDGLEQRLQDRVHRRHLALVGVVTVAGGEGLGRLVGEVGLVDVDPAERGCGALAVEPTARGGDRLRARPLLHEAGGVGAPIAEAVVVGVEAAVQAEAGVERKGAHEGAGAEAAGLEQCGQRVGAGGEAEAGVVADAVLEGVAAGEYVGVGRQRHDVLRVASLETHAHRGEPVERRRARSGPSIGAEGVGAQRVDGDEQHAEPGVAVHGDGADGAPPER